MKYSVNQRIRLFIKNENLNENSFAKRVGVTQSTIRGMFERDTNPSIETLIKITNAFPLLNPLWVVFGYGNMILAPDEVMFKPQDNELLKAQIKKEVEAEGSKVIDAYVKTTQVMEKLNEYQAKEIEELKEKLRKQNLELESLELQKNSNTIFSVNEPELEYKGKKS